MNDEIPLINSADISILMHRDAHFGGLFDIMLEYYLKGGKGVVADFDIERINELARWEKETGENLAPILLTGADAEKVAASRDSYKRLRDLYEVKGDFAKLPKLIADLILSESEEADEEIEALVAMKVVAVTPLIDILRSEEYYDSLFPGYGYAPSLAAKCLGFIGDKRAIITLFESVGTTEGFDEDIAIKALRAIGQPAEIFLLKVLKGKPWNFDNERAATALIAFKDSEEVVSTALQLLQEPEVKKNSTLSTYLALICEGLSKAEDRELFRKISQDKEIPKSLCRDMEAVMKQWV